MGTEGRNGETGERGIVEAQSWALVTEGESEGEGGEERDGQIPGIRGRRGGCINLGAGDCGSQSPGWPPMIQRPDSHVVV